MKGESSQLCTTQHNMKSFVEERSHSLVPVCQTEDHVLLTDLSGGLKHGSAQVSAPWMLLVFEECWEVGVRGGVFSGFIYVHNISQLKQGFCYQLCIQVIADVRVFPVITPVSDCW